MGWSLTSPLAGEFTITAEAAIPIAATANVFYLKVESAVHSVGLDGSGNTLFAEGGTWAAGSFGATPIVANQRFKMVLKRTAAGAVNLWIDGQLCIDGRI
jgi:hypothetical protein